MFEIYVPFYNSTFCPEYQAKALSAFMQDDDVQIIFIDNNMGRHPDVSRRLTEICEEYKFLLIENTDSICEEFQSGIEKGVVSPSDKLGRTLDLIYGLVQKRQPEYFGFLDQDCFPFRPVKLKEYLDRNGAYGKIVPTHPNEREHLTEDGEWLWNLHVIFNFFKTSFLDSRAVSFMPGSWGAKMGMPRGLALDTAGMLWWDVYRRLDKSNYILPEEHYLYFDDTSLLNPSGDHPTRVLYEVHDNKWIHMVHGATSSVTSDFLQPKTSYVKGFLDLALLYNQSPGAAHRPDYNPPYRDRNRHKSFYPQWTTIPNHDADEVITRYTKDRIFVETGTCLGRSVKHALVRGAKEVRSVEGSRAYYEKCESIFSHDPRVKLWHGNSVDKLSEMIEDIDESAVFFLDAHPAGENHVGISFGHSELQDGDESYTQHSILMKELGIIAGHPIKTHTVIIDDQHLGDPDKVQQEYKDVLLAANSSYEFSLVTKYVSEPECVCLVAEVSDKS